MCRLRMGSVAIFAAKFPGPPSFRRLRFGGAAVNRLGYAPCPSLAPSLLAGSARRTAASPELSTLRRSGPNQMCWRRYGWMPPLPKRLGMRYRLCARPSSGFIAALYGVFYRLNRRACRCLHMSDKAIIRHQRTAITKPSCRRLKMAGFGPEEFFCRIDPGSVDSRPPN